MSKVIGIDLGGTYIKFGVFEDKKLIEKFQVPTCVDNGPQSIVELILENIRNVLNNHAINAVGIGVPGIVSRDGKIVFECKNLNWVDINLAEQIEKEFNISTRIDNDANLALLAEMNFGQLKGISNGMMITLGTGVGGAVTIDGKIFRGNSGMSFEAGHMIITDRDIKCNCGRIGCFETLASATGLIRLYNMNAINKATGTKEIFELYVEKDNVAINAINEYTYYLGRGITNFINLFDPAKIVLAGGVAKSFDLFYEKLMENLEKERFSKFIELPQILYSSLGADTGVVGAALLVSDDINA